jgi:hypothetical protein
VSEISSEVDEQAAAALASILIVVDPALGPAALAKLAAAAPAGVTVVDAAAAAPAIAMAVTRILVTVGDRASAVSGTPRSRIGAVVTAPSPRTPRTPTDVVLRMPASGPPDALIDELAASLTALVSGPQAQDAKANDPRARQKKDRRA